MNFEQWRSFDSAVIFYTYIYDVEINCFIHIYLWMFEWPKHCKYTFAMYLLLI